MNSSMLVPYDVSHAALVDELEGAKEGLKKNNVKVDESLIKDLKLRVTFIHPKKKDKFYLQGDFENYNLWPPLWDWYDKTWSDSTCLNLSPAGSSTSMLSPMFIHHQGKGLICALFNRLAYGIEKGPHTDWETFEGWNENKNPKIIHAETVGDMLREIQFELDNSEGRMG